MTSQYRIIELGRSAWGAALLLAPAAVLTNVHHARADAKNLMIARILGARQLSQAALSGIRPSPEVLAMGVWVDAAHALSAVGLAAADRSRTRAGFVDAAVAAVWMAAGLYDLRAAEVTPPDHQHRRDRLALAVLRLVPGGSILRRQVRTEPVSGQRMTWASGRG